MGDELAKEGLRERHCRPCEGGTAPLAGTQVEELLAQLDGWTAGQGSIAKTFRFKNFYQTMAFVNAVAWISHHQGHHPGLVVEYASCRVSYSTHAIGGLSENDFICAARVDALLAG